MDKGIKDEKGFTYCDENFSQVFFGLGSIRNFDISVFTAFTSFWKAES